MPFLFCAAGLLRRPGRAHPQPLCANCSPQAGCPADGAFPPSRLRVTGWGISTVFGRELLPAGWLPGRWAFSPSRLRATGWAYSQPLGTNCSPQAGCPADGAFSLSRLRATGWTYSQPLCANCSPQGRKIFSPLQNRPVSLERTRAGASGGRGVHDGTGLSGSGAFLAKIDRCSRGKTVPVFSLQKPQNP